MTSDFCIAVHALVYLDHKNKLLSSEQLAENICANPVRVRKVLAALAAAGMVATREGSEGGYRFIGNAAQITLASVARCLAVRFTSMNWRSGSIDKPCLVSSGMAGVMDNILDDLNDCCERRLQKTTIATIEEKLLG